MPRLSDQMEEATVSRWLKSPADTFAKGEPLVEVETDKATMVYEAEFDGVLRRSSSWRRDGRARRRDRPPSATAPRRHRRRRRTPRPRGPADARARRRRLPAGNGSAGRTRQRATPVARRLAGELGVALEHSTAPAREGGSPGRRAPAAGARRGPGDGAHGRTREVARHCATQRTIASVCQVAREIPEFTLEAEIDMEAAARCATELRGHGREPLPSFNDFVVKRRSARIRAIPR